MTTLAREYTTLPGGARSDGDAIQAVGLGTVQTVSFTGTTAATANAVGATTSLVRLWADQDCYVVIGASPEATTSDTPLTAKTAEYFRVVPGASKVAAIQSSTGGTLHVTECT